MSEDTEHEDMEAMRAKEMEDQNQRDQVAGNLDPSGQGTAGLGIGNVQAGAGNAGPAGTSQGAGNTSGVSTGALPGTGNVGQVPPGASQTDDLVQPHEQAEHAHSGVVEEDPYAPAPQHADENHHADGKHVIDPNDPTRDVEHEDDDADAKADKKADKKKK